MIHILGKITQSYLTSDLKQNLLLTSFPTLTAALLFSVISLINLIQNQNRVQDLTTKSLSFYALLYFLSWCDGYTYKEFLNLYMESPCLNDSF